MQLRKGKVLEVVDVEKDQVLLVSLSIEKEYRLTSSMTAQGAGTASNNVPVMEHVIDLAS